jgi:hypothetical protein
VTSPELPSTSEGLPEPEGHPPGEGRPLGHRVRASVDRTIAVLIGLFLMSTIGLVLTNIHSPRAFPFWAVMFPIFGVAALWGELRRERPTGAALGRELWRGLAHWGGPLVALWIVFLLLNRGQIDGQTAGLLAILILALSCFFAGIHGAPAFIAIAAFLAAGVIGAVQLEAYLWLLIAIGAAVAVALAIWRLRGRG